MATKIIKLKESDLFRIIKRVINEQEGDSENEDCYQFGDNIHVKVIGGKLFTVKFDQNNQSLMLDKPLNGVLSELRYDINTGKLIDKDWERNFKLINENWDNIPNSKKPMQRAGDTSVFKFIGIGEEGTPMIYVGNIVEVDDPNMFFKGRQKYKKSDERGVIGINVYFKNKYISLSGVGRETGDFVSFETQNNSEENKLEPLDIESPFVFDKTILTPEAEKKFNNFIMNIKNNYSNAQGDIKVICTASIDGPGKESYDMDLSKRRAATIVEILKKNLPGIKLNYIPEGIGQTDRFAPGMKYPKVRDILKTAPNRRLIIKPSLNK